MSTKQKSKFKVGQTLVASNRSLNRTITAIRGNVVSWKNKNDSGKCKVKSLQSWASRQ